MKIKFYRSTAAAFTLVAVAIICLQFLPNVFSQGPPDLTNQNSQYAATYQNNASSTVLADSTLSVMVEQVIDGITAPMMVVPAMDTSERLFVVDQVGVIWIISSDGTKMAQPFLDIKDRIVPLNANYDERGLLSLAFSPNYASDGKIYVHYTAPLRTGAPANWSSTVHISQFTVSTDPNKIDPNSERIIMAVDKPQSNHNGGPLLFGSDGYLYLTIGDGGGGNDQAIGHTDATGNAQDLTKVLGKTLRINVSQLSSESAPQNAPYIIFSGSTISGTRPYNIPADNPFPNNQTTPSTFPTQGIIPPEIYTYGHRNPAYATFYSDTSNLILVSEAGQALFEEVDLVVNGGNYGWRTREGTHNFNPSTPQTPPSTGSTTGYLNEPLIGPIFEGGHDIGNTVIGGTVYWGNQLPTLNGKFVFGYFANTAGRGTILLATPPSSWNINNMPAKAQDLTPEDNQMWSTQILPIANAQEVNATGYLRAVSSDNNGGLYLSMSSTLGPSGTGGKIFKVSQVVHNVALYGSFASGWGFTQQSMTIPGPQIIFHSGEMYNLTLTGTDGMVHDFYVDYSGNANADTNEPISPDFTGTINFQFTPDRTGSYSYYCKYHQATMYGNANIIPEFSLLALLSLAALTAVTAAAFRKRHRERIATES